MVEKVAGQESLICRPPEGFHAVEERMESIGIDGILRMQTLKHLGKNIVG